MGSKCSLVVTGNDQKDAGHETRRRLAALVAMIAIVLGAALWTGTVLAQGGNQIRSDLEWIMRDYDIQRYLTLNVLRSLASDIAQAETAGNASPCDRRQSAPAASSMPNKRPCAPTSDRACCLGITAKTSTTVDHSPPGRTPIGAYVVASRWAMTLAKHNGSAR